MWTLSPPRARLRHPLYLQSLADARLSLDATTRRLLGLIPESEQPQRTQAWTASEPTPDRPESPAPGSEVYIPVTLRPKAKEPGK